MLLFFVYLPLKNNRPDLTYLKEACNESKNKIRKGQILILESTSYPGTTEDFLYKNLNLKRFKLGKNFFLVFSRKEKTQETKIFFNKNSKSCFGILFKMSKFSRTRIQNNYPKSDKIKFN